MGSHPLPSPGAANPTTSRGPATAGPEERATPRPIDNNRATHTDTWGLSGHKQIDQIDLSVVPVTQHCPIPGQCGHYDRQRGQERGRYVTNSQPAPSKNRRSKSSDIPDSKLVELRAQGMSLEQVGKVVGMTKQAVHLRLKRYNIDPNELAEFKRQKPDILDAAQAKMVEAILDPDVISKANLLQRATTFAILFDKHRLQTNQSTSNLAVSGSLSQLRQRAHQSRMADYAAEAEADRLPSPAVDARETAYRDTVAAHNHDSE